VVARKSKTREYGAQLRDEQIPKQYPSMIHSLSLILCADGLEYHSHWQRPQLRVLLAQTHLALVNLYEEFQGRRYRQEIWREEETPHAPIRKAERPTAHQFPSSATKTFAAMMEILVNSLT